MTTRRRLFEIACTWATALPFVRVAPAHASIAFALDVPTLVDRARTIVVADVVDVQVRWDHSRRHILTTTQLLVRESWKGQLEVGKTVPMVQRGGTLDGLEMRVLGQAGFTVGERALLFLGDGGGNPYVLGLAQGKWTMTRHEQGQWHVRMPSGLMPATPGPRDLGSVDLGLTEVRAMVKRLSSGTKAR